MREFRKLKKRSDAAMAQISDEDLFKAVDENNNSLALIFKHINGKMHLRWQDFLTTDGEVEVVVRQQLRLFALKTKDRMPLTDAWEGLLIRANRHGEISLHRRPVPLQVLLQQHRFFRR